MRIVKDRVTEDVIRKQQVHIVTIEKSPEDPGDLPPPSQTRSDAITLADGSTFEKATSAWWMAEDEGVIRMIEYVGWRKARP